MAVRRTAGFCEFFNRSIVRRPTDPNASRIEVRRSRVRGRSSTDSASASGRTSTSPSDTHIALTRSNCASSMVARWVVMCRIIAPAISMSIAVMACCRRAVDRCRRLRATSTPITSIAASKSPTSSRSSSRRDHRLHQLAPAILLLLDAQQVEHQRQVERAQRGGRDRASHAPMRSGGSSWPARPRRLGAGARQLAPVRRRTRTSRRSRTSAASRRRGSRPTRSPPCSRAATPPRRRARASAAAAAGRCRAPASGTPARADRSACSPRSTWRATNRAIVAVGHPADDGLHQRAVLRRRVAALAEQPEQHVGRALADRGGHVAQHRLELLGVVLRHHLDDAAQHPHQRRGLGADAASPSPLASSVAISSREPVAVAGNAEQFADAASRRGRTRCPGGSW